MSYPSKQGSAEHFGGILFLFVKYLTWFLVAVDWFWTAHECNTIGIDVFDMLLKRFPGQLWLMAAVLTYLTIIWMPEHLLTRAVSGLSCCCRRNCSK